MKSSDSCTLVNQSLHGLYIGQQGPGSHMMGNSGPVPGKSVE